MRCVTAGMAMLFAAGAVCADTISISESARGRYTSGGIRQSGNYFTASGSTEYRSFFVFDLPALAGVEVTGARLSLNTGTVFGGTISIPVQFTSTALTPAQLAVGPSTANFAALGVGTVFGERAYTSADAGVTHQVEFNAAGIAAVSDALGSYLVVSARVLLTGSTQRGVYGGAISHSVDLEIDYRDVPPPPVVPLPGAGGLALAGLGVLAGRRRR